MTSNMIYSLIVILTLLSIINDLFVTLVLTGFGPSCRDSIFDKLIIHKYMRLRDTTPDTRSGFSDYDANTPIVLASLCVVGEMFSVAGLLFSVVTSPLALEAIDANNLESVSFLKNMFLGAYGLSVIAGISGILYVRSYIQTRHLKLLRPLIEFAAGNNADTKSLLNIDDKNLAYKIIQASELDQTEFNSFWNNFKQDTVLMNQIKDAIPIMKRTDIKNLIDNSDVLHVELNNIYHQLYNEINKNLHLIHDTQRTNKTIQTKESQKLAHQIGDKLARQIGGQLIQQKGK